MHVTLDNMSLPEEPPSAQGIRRWVYTLRVAESILRKGFHGAARVQRVECRVRSAPIRTPIHAIDD